MIHHNTKSGNEMHGGLKDLIWTNINNLTLCCDLDPECSNPTFSQDTLAYMMYHETKFGCHGINSSENIVEKIIFWSNEPSL